MPRPRQREGEARDHCCRHPAAGLPVSPFSPFSPFRSPTIAVQPQAMHMTAGVARAGARRRAHAMPQKKKPADRGTMRALKACGQYCRPHVLLTISNRHARLYQPEAACVSRMRAQCHSTGSTGSTGTQPLRRQAQARIRRHAQPCATQRRPDLGTCAKFVRRPTDCPEPHAPRSPSRPMAQAFGSVQGEGGHDNRMSVHGSRNASARARIRRAPRTPQLDRHGRRGGL